MAKVELHVFSEDGSVERVVKRNFISTALWAKYSKLLVDALSGNEEQVTAANESVKPFVLDLFPDLTSDEYDNKVDHAEIQDLLVAVYARANNFEIPESVKNA